MLDVCLLGTAGMVPLRNRFLTSFYAVSDGHAVLTDCGEGTQVAIASAGVRAKIIDTILLTHFHADHVGGLAGLLLSMGNAGRTEDVTIVGPPGLAKILRCLLVVAAPPFRILAFETDGSDDDVFHAGSIQIRPFPVNHVVPCLGWQLTLPRPGRFDADRARALDIPLSAWKILQGGGEVKVNDRIIRSDMVMGPPRRGLKVVYSTDSRPTDSMAAFGRDADLMVLEGIYGDEGKIEKAETWGHMTFPEAAEVAKKAGARELWLTHFSQALDDPDACLPNASAIFPNTRVGKDGMKKSLRFTD